MDKTHYRFIIGAIIFFALAFAATSYYAANRDKWEMHDITDNLVEELQEHTSRYYTVKNPEKQTTAGGKYSVIPVGRLIVVQSDQDTEDGFYEQLRDDLSERYEGHEGVRKVYINGFGTVVVDCR